MTKFIKLDLFDLYLQSPEDELEWELDRDHPSEWWDLFNSWLEYPEDEPASDEVTSPDIAEDDGLRAR